MGGARVVFTDRHGGVSQGPYESANLADHVGDDPDAVARNRVLAAARAGMAGPDEWVGLHQVHGNDVVRGRCPAQEPCPTPTRRSPPPSGCRS